VPPAPQPASHRAIAGPCQPRARNQMLAEEARSRNLLRTVAALAPEEVQEGDPEPEPSLEAAAPELWLRPETAAEGDEGGAQAGGAALEGVPDPTGGGLFFSHAWDEPKDWAKYFSAQRFVDVKQMQASTGLRVALERGLGHPRVWLDCACLPARASGGEPPLDGDHPVEQVSFGPYRMTVRALKDPAFLPPTESSEDSYTLLQFLEGHRFEGTMKVRKFDAAGRPGGEVEPLEVCWEIPKGFYYMRGACVISEDKVSPEAAAAKDPFCSRREQLRTWCSRLGLRDEIWVEFTLGTVRAECLMLTEPMLVLHDGFVAVAAWNYFDRLWPLCEWAVFCARRGPERVQLAADAFLGPTAAEYHWAFRRLSVESAGCQDPLDRQLLLGWLRRVFACEVLEQGVDYSGVERYVRATAIAVFAREAALAASRERHADDEAGWIALAAELKLSELHGALRRCKPWDWHQAAKQGREEEEAEAAYAAAVEAWWTGSVLPVLRDEGRRALR